VQLVEAVLEEAGILEHFADIRGNSFDILDNTILGLERETLLGGSRGKATRTKDLPEKYARVLTIGDDKSDIGLFRYFRRKLGDNVELYALESGAKSLKRFVGTEKVLPSIVEFLKL